MGRIEKRLQEIEAQATKRRGERIRQLEEEWREVWRPYSDKEVEAIANGTAPYSEELEAVDRALTPIWQELEALGAMGEVFGEVDHGTAR